MAGTELSLFVIFLIASMGLAFAVTTVIPGDVYIEGVFAINKPENGNCGDIDPVSVQNYEAVKWTIDRLNAVGYITGLTLGLKVHTTCGLAKNALDVAYSIARDNTNTTLAIIGPEYSEEAVVMSKLLSSVPEDERLLQVGFRTTASELSDKTVYKNFFRVIPSEDIEFKVIKNFIKSLTWTYFAIIHESDAYGSAAVRALTSSPDDGTLITCFPEVTSINTTRSIEEIQADLIMVLERYETRNVTINGVMVFGGSKLGQAFLGAVEALQISSDDYEIPVILMSAESMSFEGETYGNMTKEIYENITKGTYLSSPPREAVQEFESHWVDVLNGITNDTYLKQIQEQFTGCNVSQMDCSSYIREHLPQSTFVQYAIQATMVTAKAIKTVICNGSPAVCTALINEPKTKFINAMENIIFRFGDLNLEQFSQAEIEFPEGNNDATTTGITFSIYNKRTCSITGGNSNLCFEKVYSYFHKPNTFQADFDNIRDYTSLTGKESNYPHIRKPQCPEHKTCTECPERQIAEYEMEEGDMYVVGISPIHGKSDTPFKCGKIKSGGFDCAESIKFTIQQSIEDFKDNIPQAKIGYIIIDSCNDPQIILGRILDIHHRGVIIDGQYQDVKSKILAYVGGWISDVSLTVAETLTRLGYVQISYGSTSPLLSDRVKYPYFMRVVQSDVKQGKEMLDIVKQSGSNLVQILHSKTSYGYGGMESIVNNAKEYGICIANIVGVDQTETINKADIINSLMQNNSPKIVLVFLSSFDVVLLIKELNDNMKGYIFIASEAWGNRDIISSLPNLQGSITLANELPIDDRFKDYFRKLSPNTSKSPWLQKYMENYFKCYFEWSFDKSSANYSQCSSSEKFDTCLTGSSCFKIETWVPFTSLAVEAILRGSRTTLMELCNRTDTICKEFREQPLQLVKNIASLELLYDKISRKQVFAENHDGVISYNRYLVKVDSMGTAVYTKFPENWYWNQSTCSVIPNANCTTCFSETITEVSPDDDSTATLRIVVIVFATTTSILLLVLVAGCYMWRKRKCCFKDILIPADEYITATYDKHRDYSKDNNAGFSDGGYLHPMSREEEGEPEVLDSGPAGCVGAGGSAVSMTSSTDDMSVRYGPEPIHI